MGRMLGVINRGGLQRLGPSKFNFGGMGRWMFKKMMAQKGVSTLEELRAAALDLGVHFLACKMSMDVMEIRREDLIPEVEDVVGAAKAIKEASASQINYFI
jgi:peroxiredoxin family protein